MRKWLVVAALLATTLGAAVAQENRKYDMGIMQMVFLRRVPGTHIETTARTQQDYLEGLARSGKCALGGATKGQGDLAGVYVFKDASPAEATAMAREFPAVKAGAATAEVLSWYAARDVIGSARAPISLTGYVFGLLVRGSEWMPAETEETKKIQEGHMANIRRLAGLGKLVLAGPFENGGDRRGVFIFKVGTLAEAQALTDTDPAVAAGRLKIELYHWKVPAGVLP